MVALDKRTAIGLSSYQFMAMARRGLFYTFLSLYLKDGLGLSVTGTTLLASLSMIANSVSQTFVWGKISDKYRIRAGLVVIGETTAAIGYVLIYFLHLYLLDIAGSTAAASSIIGGLTLLEFFWSMSNLGWSALLSDVSTHKERGTLMSVVSSVGGVGRIMGISISGLLYNLGGEAGGFRNGALFFFPSGIMLASALLIWLTTRSSEQSSRKRRIETHEPPRTTPTAFSYGTFYWFLASMFIIGLGTHSILQILIFYVDLDSPIGASASDIAAISNAASVATIAASLLAGSLADKIGRKTVLTGGLALTVVTPVLFILAQSTAQMVIINSLSGISTALISVVGYLLVSDLIPAGHRGRLFGQYNAATSISFGIAGTIIGGPIADYMIAMGSKEATAYITAFQAASAISLVGTILFVSKVKTKSREEPNQSATG
jgi:MFS family permease